MPITKREKLLVETICDGCCQSQGTSLIDKKEYPDWLKHTTDLLTFEVAGKSQLLCWDCIVRLGKTREYDRRLNALTYPKDKE